MFIVQVNYPYLYQFTGSILVGLRSFTYGLKVLWHCPPISFVWNEEREKRKGRLTLNYTIDFKVELSTSTTPPFYFSRSVVSHLVVTLGSGGWRVEGTVLSLLEVCRTGENNPK